MTILLRSHDNPILRPDPDYAWEAQGTFNPSVIKHNNTYHMVYRALSSPRNYAGVYMNLSTIGYAVSEDGIHFSDNRQLIEPEYDWEKFGCEDPRITKIDDSYFICYTALSTYPFTPEGIKVGIAMTKDLKSIDEKHPVTPFNAKAMSLFPNKIDGKYAAILTVNTDYPPAKIALALFEKIEDIWSLDYWKKWYESLEKHVIPLQRSNDDHIEAGAPPIKTQDGWILFYCYIRNYSTRYRVFGVEVVRLDLNNPYKVTGKITDPLLLPEKGYELYGNVANVVFPSGAVAEGSRVLLYYGASDTTSCVAWGKLEDLLGNILSEEEYQERQRNQIRLTRFENNPILEPIHDNKWESKFVFNPAAIYEKGKVHLVYRAMGDDDTSTFGYASTGDGVHIDGRLHVPIYLPREDFEMKLKPGNSGCEDPRIVRIDDRLYMCYTAYDNKNPPRVAFTHIALSDFLNKQFKFEKPILISPPDIDDKDACLLPEKVQRKYLFFHRFDPYIWVDYVENLTFSKHKWLKGKILMKPRIDKWDSAKIGLGAPPIKTGHGWLLIYHGLSRDDKKYRLGAALLDLYNPENIIGRLPYPILEPETNYEHTGSRPGTVFTCGAVILGMQLMVYYGASDQVIAGASFYVEKILRELKKAAP
ncbi:hypothetical protein HY407_03260 [Candidatus Gottesmanbacteria bacterium]|nr:hypothetical protein [Candidatus Gottesmanbacteria bacterium]